MANAGSARVPATRCIFQGHKLSSRERAWCSKDAEGSRSQPCLRRCRMEQPVTSTAADYRLPAPQFLGRQPMLEINGLTGRVTDQKTEEPVARPAEARIKRGRGGGPTKSTGKNAYSTRTASRTVRQTVRASIARRGARLRADHQPTLCRTLLRDCCAAFSVFGGSKVRRIPETLP